jgi:hypothetical protein
LSGRKGRPNSPNAVRDVSKAKNEAIAFSDLRSTRFLRSNHTPKNGRKNGGGKA